MLASCALVIREGVGSTRRNDTLATWCANAQHVLCSS
jgi:hypothetical protein